MSSHPHPLEPLATVDCGHTRHWSMCAQCAADAVRPELDRLAELENTLGWETTCTSCARVLDASVRDHERAEKAEREAAAYRELLGSIWLYVSWRYVTRQLTTEQKELWADAVESTSDGEDPVVAPRWWRDDAPAARHTGGNAEDCPACDGRTDLPYPWICPGTDPRRT